MYTFMLGTDFFLGSAFSRQLLYLSFDFHPLTRDGQARDRSFFLWAFLHPYNISFEAIRSFQPLHLSILELGFLYVQSSFLSRTIFGCICITPRLQKWAIQDFLPSFGSSFLVHWLSCLTASCKPPLNATLALMSCSGSSNNTSMVT